MIVEKIPDFHNGHYQPLARLVTSMTNPTVQCPQSNLPTFKMERLIVRPRVLADTVECLAMDRDPEVTRFVTGPWSDPAAHQAFIERRTRGPYPPGLGYWTICLRENPTEFVGWLFLIPTDAGGPEIETGWRLPRRAWGRGFATEAARPMLSYAFTCLRLPEVIAEIDPENLGSIRVAEKLGLTRGSIIHHQGKDAARYSMTVSEAAKSLT